MKRFSHEVSFPVDGAFSHLSTFRESPTGEWVRASDAMEIQRKLMQFQRAGLWIRFKTWLLGFSVEA